MPSSCFGVAWSNEHLASSYRSNYILLQMYASLFQTHHSLLLCPYQQKANISLISLLLFTMKEEGISHIFVETQWNSHIPEKYAITTRQIKLNKVSIEYLANDDTNPNIKQFQHHSQILVIIKELGGAVFVKAANRSAKDCSHLQNKVMSVKDLVMLVKLSEYITEALCEEEDEATLILRRYYEYLQPGNDQYRAYTIQGTLVGICQKNPSFLGTMPTINQISAITRCQEQVQSNLFDEQRQSYVIDLYCSPNGKDVKILAIEPFHIHGLSLFTEDELKQHFAKNKTKPLIRMAETQEQLKDTDLSQYRPGSQLQNFQNVKQWISFMQAQPQK